MFLCNIWHYLRCVQGLLLICCGVSGVQQRQQNVRVQSIDIVCQENLWDTARAFGIAMIANIAVLVVAATTFHNVGLVILNLQDANTLLEQVLCSSPLNAKCMFILFRQQGCWPVF